MPKFQVSINFELNSNHDPNKVSEEILLNEIGRYLPKEVSEWAENFYGGEVKDLSIDITTEQEIVRDKRRDIAWAVFGLILLSYVMYKEFSPLLHWLLPSIF
jgi:hypothetical protein